MTWKIKAYTKNLNEREMQTVLFAASELKRYLSLVTDESVMLSEDPELTDSGIILGVGLSEALPKVEDVKFDDAILIDVKVQNGLITATNARSVLIAVYRYLKELGYKFFRPGKNGEIYPKRIPERDVFVCEAADHRLREICIEGSCSYETVEDMIDWIPKVGMNSYYIQFFAPYVFFDRWYGHEGYGYANPYIPKEPISLREVEGITRSITREINKRGICEWSVGHGWTMDPFGLPSIGWYDVDNEALPDEYKKHIALRKGIRKTLWGMPMHTQLCYGNPEVRERMTDYFVDYCKKNPNVDCVCFSFADSGNNHCECELCRDLLPADWFIICLNEIDEKLTAAGLETKVGIEIYVDTLWPPIKERLKNQSRFIMQVAPSSRTYSGTLATKTDKQMTEYKRNELKFPKSTEEFLAYMNAWRDGIFEGDWCIYDYYFMWDCYKDLGYTNTARLIRDDIRLYKELNFSGLISCQSQRTFTPTSLGMNIMARTLWNREIDFDTERDEIMESEFGETFALVRDYLEKMSVYSVPRAARLEIQIQTKENIELYEKGLELIRDFLPVIDENIASTEGVQQLSWKNLRFHAGLSDLLIKAYLAFAKGERDESHWKNIVDYADKNEWSVRQYFDCWLMEYSLSNVFKRLMKEPVIDLDSNEIPL